MTALWLDYQQNQTSPWTGPVLLAAATIALVLAGVHYLDLDEQAAAWEGRLERIERGHGRQAMAVYPGGQTEELAVEVEHANEVLRQLTLPWDELFQAVESAAGKKIALLALEPDTEKRMVKISGEAKDFSSLLNYVMQLEERDVFGPVYLQNHQVKLQDPDKPVRFSLLAVWRGKP
jgi:hypothetical protein